MQYIFIFWWIRKFIYTYRFSAHTKIKGQSLNISVWEWFLELPFTISVIGVGWLYHSQLFNEGNLTNQAWLCCAIPSCFMGQFTWWSLWHFSLIVPICNRWLCPYYNLSWKNILVNYFLLVLIKGSNWFSVLSSLWSKVLCKIST